MVKLVEGNEYEFLVEKEIDSPDGERRYVLSGPDRKKYLIPENLYKTYSISVGSIIICRIDKINCKGKIFLEPRNPFYKEGESYNFEVIGHSVKKDRKGRALSVMTVKDKNGNIQEVFHNLEKDLPEAGSATEMKIGRITKGRIHLINRSDLD